MLEINYNAIQIVAIISFAVSALSLLITRTSSFLWLRSTAARINRWLGELFECYFCISCWLGLGVFLVYQPVMFTRNNIVIDAVISICVIVSWSTIITQFYLSLMAKK